ncbi:gliding motility-associated C-terminal domain-containing protein [Chitinophaga solisilvae]|uniref:gliding motility-associated C-terminal domain-containing protein n=1 Tax=Chitinophaga solisilvae TaxID=1233460 RepID=UPI00136DD396|nr:gliding motility-associated C-terminal domain-containing protein [Chitinophaga solisilvae]
MAGAITIASAQTVVNKGTLHITGNTIVYFGDDFLNEGSYYNDGQTTFKKNMQNNGNIAVTDTGATYFNGNTLQKITGSVPASFYKAFMNNTTTGIAYETDHEMGIRHEMHFMNGIVKTTGQGKVLFFNGARPVKPSDYSHVSGSVAKKGNEAFLFPIGNDQYYRPAGISAPLQEDEIISASYHLRDNNTSRYDPRLTDDKTGKVNTREYWILTRDAGNTPVAVTLTWDKDKTGTVVASLPALLTARWNGQRWENAGAANVNGTSTQGAIASNPASKLGPFTFSELLRKAIIGLAQIASEPLPQPDQTYSVTFTLILRNMGDLPLDSVTLTHNIANTFPFPMKFKRSGIITTGGELVPNEGFDGNADIALLKELSKLAPNQQDTVTFKVSIAPEGRYGTFYSSAQVAGKNGDLIVKDLSNNGEIMPPGNNGDPTAYNEPTPVTLKMLKIKIPEGISPNGDGKNDRLVIDGLEPNDQVDMKIFNRWGDAVYENPDYRNSWDGRANRGLRIGDQLPDGTYYYVITIKDKTQPGKIQRFVGFLTLMR